jgi:UDP-N-acetylmuramate dehydrogenase
MPLALHFWGMSSTVLSNISLKPFNTFGVDVSAKQFATFSSLDDLSALLNEKIINQGAMMILGGGSNILFTRNYDGTVLKNEMTGMELVGEDDVHYYVKAQAGEVWHNMVMYCIEHNYAGVENLALIPGCVGAGPMQNIGAYGVELKDIFHSLEAYHIKDHVIKNFDLAECSFGYRESIFKRKEKGNWVIISVTFRLNKRPVLNTSYGAIDVELDKMALDHISIKDVAQAVINIRSSKLPNPKEIGNAGSFFKNPVVPMSVYQSIKAEYPEAPCFPINDEEVKVPAGWLIERAGWKGKTFERYGVHKNQALVLVNYGGATGTEIYDLSTSIIDDIKSKFKIELEREVNIM